MKHLLIVTTNFPPASSIGTQRILRISKYLSEERWKVSVLTLNERYSSGGRGRLDYPDRLAVHRTGKLDPVEVLLRLRGRLFGSGERDSEAGRMQATDKLMAAKREGKTEVRISRWQQFKDLVTDLLQFPDKQVSWIPPALLYGWRLVRRDKVDVIFSSAPPHSILLLATLLKRVSGARLVIDFRDPWARSPWLTEVRNSSGYERFKTRLLERFEHWVVNTADSIVFVTPEMRDDFVRHYPELPADKFQVFFNGFDPDNVPGLAPRQAAAGDGTGGPVTFVHTGTLYRRRDPTPMLRAVHNLLRRGEIDRGELFMHFVGTVTPELAAVKDLVATLDLEGVVRFTPSVPYAESLELMADSDVLILLQPVTHLQIPAKFYDYICFEKPILAVCEPNGAVDNLVRGDFGVSVDYNSVTAQEAAILTMLRHPFDPAIIRANRPRFDMSRAIAEFESVLDPTHPPA